MALTEDSLCLLPALIHHQSIKLDAKGWLIDGLCYLFFPVYRAKAYEMFPGNIKVSEKFWMTGFLKGLILPAFYIRSTKKHKKGKQSMLEFI